MNKYRLVAKKGEGTFSEVLKAQCIKNGKYVAIKCMKNHFDSLDQVNNLREIQALRRLSPHLHIVKLIEVLYDQPTGRLALVFELMDMNIYELIRGRRHYVAEERIRNYMYQLMKAMDHMHRNGIFHRDIKPENILIMDDCLKLADFGSCRGIYSKQPYTEYISTRWYRAPECLLTDGYYNYKMDMWGVGCVFFEIVSLFPLFPGTNELDQIQKIHNILGTPPPELLAKMKKRSQQDFNFPAKEGTGIPKLIPHAPPECIDLICKLLAYNPDDRLSARQALKHSYFRDIREAEKRQKALMSPDTTGAASEASMPSVAPEQYKQAAAGGSHRGQSNGSDGNDGTQLASPAEHRQHSEAGSNAAHGLPSIAKPHHHAQQAQHQADTSVEDGSLPPIGNLSLEKAHMAANSTARRGAFPNFPGKAVAVHAVGGAASNAAAAKTVRQGMPATGKHPQHHSVGAAAPLAPQPSAKGYVKANATTGAVNKAGSSKYLSPYSLRNLAIKEQA